MPSPSMALSWPVIALLVATALSQSISPCPQGNGTMYTESNGNSYTLLCGLDTNPGAIATVTSVTSFLNCISLCDANSGCFLATYSPGIETCYLKPAPTSMTANSDLVSANRYVPPPPYPVPQANYVNASSGCGTPLGQGITAGGASTSVNFTSPDGLVRNYLIHIPSTYDITMAAPLIITFHGRGDTPAIHEAQTGFSTSWNPYGIVVYPAGVQAQWEGDPAATGTSFVDDQGFIDALLTNLESNYCLDTGRIFAAGFSNGGGFSGGVLACNTTLSNRFAAFAPHSGAYYVSTTAANCNASTPYTETDNNLITSVCTAGRPNIPIIEFHGDADATALYYGGSHRSYCLPAISHWVTDWSVRDGHSTSNVSTSLLGGNVTKYEFGMDTGPQGVVVHYQIANWGHYWSSVSGGSPIDATPNIVDFFYRFTNPNGSTLDYLSTSSISSMSSTSSMSSSASTTSVSVSTTSSTSTVATSAPTSSLSLSSSSSSSSLSSSPSPSSSTLSTSSSSSLSLLASSSSSSSSLMSSSSPSAATSGSTTATISSATSSLSSSSSTSPSLSIVSTISTTSSSSTISSSPTGYPPCPAANMTTQLSPQSDNPYTLYCGFDSDYASYTFMSVPQGSDYSACFPYCDSDPMCVSFTFESTLCYLRSHAGNPTPANPGFVLGARNFATSSSSSSSSSAATSSSSSSSSSVATSSSSSTSSIVATSSPLSSSSSTVATSASTSTSGFTNGISTSFSTTSMSTTSISVSSTSATSVPTTSLSMTSSTEDSCPATTTLYVTAGGSTASSSGASTGSPTSTGSGSGSGSASSSGASAGSPTSTGSGSGSASISGSSSSSGASNGSPTSTGVVSGSASGSASFNSASSTQVTTSPAASSPTITATATITGSYTTASLALSSTTSASPAPPCPTDLSACGSANGTTCTDPNGNAYYLQCNTIPTGGTIIAPSNMKRDGYLQQGFGIDPGSMESFSGMTRQTKRQFLESDFQSCQSECDATLGCIAITYQNQTSMCTMYSSLTGGYASSPGTQFALSQPAADPVVSSSSSVSKTIGGGSTSVVASQTSNGASGATSGAGAASSTTSSVSNGAYTTASATSSMSTTTSGSSSSGSGGAQNSGQLGGNGGQSVSNTASTSPTSGTSNGQGQGQGGYNSGTSSDTGIPSGYTAVTPLPTSTASGAMGAGGVGGRQTITVTVMPSTCPAYPAMMAATTTVYTTGFTVTSCSSGMCATPA